MEKKCKHCAMQIPSEAKTCPYCRKKQPMTFDNRRALILIGILLALGIVGNVTEPEKKPPTPEEVKQRQAQSDSLDAQVAAKQFVTERLKAPSSARWQNSAEVAVGKVKGTKNRWLVSGWVEAQNSYGATPRTRYWATVVKKENSTWVLAKLQTE